MIVGPVCVPSFLYVVTVLLIVADVDLAVRVDRYARGIVQPCGDRRRGLGSIRIVGGYVAAAIVGDVDLAVGVDRHAKRVAQAGCDRRCGLCSIRVVRSQNRVPCAVAGLAADVDLAVRVDRDAERPWQSGDRRSGLRSIGLVGCYRAVAIVGDVDLAVRVDRYAIGLAQAGVIVGVVGVPSALYVVSGIDALAWVT